jgi:predicted metal-dependent peptidase
MTSQIFTTLATYEGPPLNEVALQAARLWVLHKRPYYAAVLLRCPIVVSDQISTLAVDSMWRIYVNPSYANNLQVPRLAAALIHEVNHLIRDHHSRAERCNVHTAFEQFQWNLAGDAEINDDLAEDDLDVDHRNWIFPGRLNQLNDLTAEIYYRKLNNSSGNSAQSHPDPNCGSGAGGRKVPGELDPEDADAAAVSQVEAKVIRRTVAAAVQAYGKSHGNVPGSLELWAKQELEPKLDWRRILAAQLRASVAVISDSTDYTYMRFSRRSSAVPDVRLAGMFRNLPNVAVVVDTSGSMSQQDIDQVLSEAQGILCSCGVADDSITLLTVDTAVTVCKKINRIPNGLAYRRGGTDMRIGIDAAIGLKPRPDLIIVLTDGYTPWPEHPPRAATVMAAIIGPAPDIDNIPVWMPAVHIPSVE